MSSDGAEDQGGHRSSYESTGERPTVRVTVNPDTDYVRKIPERVGGYEYQPGERGVVDTFLVVWRAGEDGREYVSIRTASALRGGGYQVKVGEGADVEYKERINSFTTALEFAVGVMKTGSVEEASLNA